MTTELDRESVTRLRAVLDAVEASLFTARPHSEATGAGCAERVDSLCALFDQMMDADNANELDWVRDVPGCEETSDLLNVLWSRWLALADYTSVRLPKCVGHGVAPDQVSRLSHLIRDVRAFLNPSYVISGKMLEFRDEAIAEYARGETLEGLVD